MFAEALEGFFNDFAEAATWSVGPKSVYVIFDNAYVSPLGDFEATGPAATIAAADVPNVAQGQTLTIRGTLYTITAVEPDTTGDLVVCRLRT